MTEASQSLKKNGKTFWLASLFLPNDIAADAATLYAFCRRMDDLADQPSVLDAKDQLEQVREELHAGRSGQPVIMNLIQLAARRGLDLQAADCLLKVLIEDACEDLCLKDEPELLKYCYGAAGTVGLMMSAVLQVPGSAAKIRAIDLGIAMQLTNIARDVQEDALMNRRYLPSIWVGGLRPEEIRSAQSGSPEAEKVKLAIQNILNLADVFYSNGVQGFPSIPQAARKGIRIAATLYRQIGMELHGRGCDFTRGRVVVSLPMKLTLAAGVLLGSSELERIDCKSGSDDLHSALAGFPGFA